MCWFEKYKYPIGEEYDQHSEFFRLTTKHKDTGWSIMKSWTMQRHSGGCISHLLAETPTLPSLGP